MSRTFEELASEQLDAMYQGARFLAGGDPARAGRLLTRAVTSAFDEYARIPEPRCPERWLESRLVGAALDAGPPSPPQAQVDGEWPGAGGPAFERIGSDELFAAASVLPPLPRAALWLVVLRRRSYEDAASILRVPCTRIPALLAHRRTLLDGIFEARRSRRARTGSD